MHRASPKIKVPFVAAVVEADDGTMIRSNLLVEPDPEQITFPMRVRLDIYSVGTDSQGSECVAFGFAPLQGSETSHQEGGQSKGGTQNIQKESTQGSETSHQESSQAKKSKSVPSLPTIPSLPDIPSIPSLPDISTVPQGAQDPQVPQAPRETQVPHPQDPQGAA